MELALASLAMAEERSLGGTLNDAVRVGATGRRRAGPWTPAGHKLRRFREREGFPAPRARGLGEQGCEILEYLNGEAHAGTPVPLPDSVFREDHMIGAARLFRRYHDLVARFAPSPGATWRLVGPSPHELICHNDWSPWNALFRAGQFALTLDWDLAGAGTAHLGRRERVVLLGSAHRRGERYSRNPRANAAAPGLLRRVRPRRPIRLDRVAPRAPHPCRALRGRAGAPRRPRAAQARRAG